MASPFRAPRTVALFAALAALLSALVVTSPSAHAGSAVTTLKARIDTALRGIGATHVDYRIRDSGVGTINRHSSVATAPASNEKLITATAALHFLTPSFRYSTLVSGTSPVVNHTLDGDLVLKGSGDPTLQFGNLLAMAKALHSAGLRRVTGHLIVDDTRYSHRTIVTGWKHKFVPEETGTVDAFSLNGNEWRSGSAFNADPTPYNATIWRQELKRAHISVAKRTIIAAAPAKTTPLLTHRSKPLGTIIKSMLTDSVNFYAEMILRELGAARSGHGTPATGVVAVKATAHQLHLPLGKVYDGSGLSYADRETPATLVAWLDRISSASYFTTIYRGLPLSCATGTLQYRLCGRNVRDRIRAKTGTLNHVATLSGYLNAKSGRRVTFSILVSGFPDTRYNRIFSHVDAALAQVSIHG